MFLGKRLLNLGAVVSLSVIIAACGSSNDPETRVDTSESPINVSGNAVKGVIVNGIVSLYYENAAGQPVVLSRSRTDTKGNFSIDLSQLDDDTVALVEISADADTTMRCDLTMGCDVPGGPVNFGAQLRLPDGFKLLGAVNPETSEAFVSPLSHLIVLAAQQGSDELTYAALELASDQLQQAFELNESPLHTRTPDLTNLAQGNDLSEAQLKQAIVSAALFESSMSSEWLDDSVSLANLDLEVVVLTASVVATELLERDAVAQYASAVTSISAETTEHYLNLAYDAPRITSNPVSRNLTVGEAGTLSVTVSGTGPFTYQWFKDDDPIPDATSASLNFSPATLADEGIYFVEVADGQNTARSLTALLNVAEYVEPIVITSQPSRQSVMEGGSASFSVTATGTTPITFQWRRNGTDISGATGPTLTLNNVQLANNGSTYDVLIRNPVSTTGVRSNSATLEVSALPVPARIESHPTAQALTEGQALLLQVSASGDAPIRYQWIKGGVIIPGATGPSFSIASVTLANAGDYYVTVENDSNTQPARSNTVTVVVTEAIAPVSITRQPQNATVTAGDSATLSVGAIGGGFLTYQWYKTACSTLSGSLINSANSSTLTLNPVQLTDTGSYCVRISNGTQPPAVSSLASLTVLPSEIPVSILTQPVAQNIYLGEPFTLSVVATGNDDLTYQWFKDNNATPVYSGGSVFNISSAEFDDAGAYRVTVRNTDGDSSATSNEVIVRVADRPSLLLSWSRPLTRMDDSELAAEDVSGYVIEYGYEANNYTHSVTIDGGDTLNHELRGLQSGAVYLRIATRDSDNQLSPFSAPLIVSIP